SSSSLREGERRLADADAPGGTASAVEPGTPLSTDAAADASGAASTTTSSDETGATNTASRGSAPDSTAIGGTGQGGAGKGTTVSVLPKHPGGSYLYDASRRPRGRVPSGLESPSSADTKALQLQRADDIAEKRGSLIGQLAAVDATAI